MVKAEAFLAIEGGLADRLQRTWDKLSVEILTDVSRAVRAGNFDLALELAGKIDLTPVFTENREYIRYSLYSGLLFGATRVTEDPRITVVNTVLGDFDHVIDKLEAQLRFQVTESMKARVVDELQSGIYDAEAEANPEPVYKYDPSQPRAAAGTPTGGQWVSAGGAEVASVEEAVSALWIEQLTADEVGQLLELHGEKVKSGSPLMQDTVKNLWRVGDAVVEWDGDDSPTVHRNADQFVYDADVSGIASAIEERDNSDFWDNPRSVYHASPGENEEAITGSGLEARNQTRGFSNRGTGRAVFTSENPEAIDSYGPVVFEIDTDAMAKDGVKPFISKEEPIIEAEARSALAHAIGIKDFQPEVESGIEEATWILHGNVPAKYLKVAFKSQKYDPRQPRDERGRWTDGGALDVLAAAGTDPGDQRDKAREFVMANDWHKVQDALPTRQREALLHYTGGGHEDINEFVRGDQAGTPSWEAEQASYAKDLDAAIEKQPPLKDDLVVYRGGYLPDGVAEPGDEFTDKGFVSTSLQSSVAESFADDEDEVVVRIRVPAGTKVLPGAGGEMEAILPRGKSFRVVSVEEDVPVSFRVIDKETISRKVVTVEMIESGGIKKADGRTARKPASRFVWRAGDLIVHAKKYDPNQPRDPAGTATGGQWTKSNSPPEGKRERFDTEEQAAAGTTNMNYEQMKAHLGDDGVTAMFDRVRAKQRAWDAQMRRAISLGTISEAEAKKQGWFSLNGDKVEPLPQELYHVTTAFDSVMAEGLKTRDELGQGSGKGLGGGTSDTISFTTDKEIAAGIESAVLLMHDVLNDKVSVESLIEKAKTGEDAKRPFMDFITKLWGGAVADNGLPVELDAALRGRHVEHVGPFHKLWPKDTSVTTDPKIIAEKMGKGWQYEPAGEKTGFGSGFYSRPATTEEVDDTKTRFTKYYLGARENAGGGLDPLFFSADTGGLKKVPRDQIKTVQAIPKAGAHGYQVSSLGEWRVWTGDVVQEVKTVGTKAETIWKFDPDQPRDPAGTSTGGQWTSTTGSAAFKAWFGDSKVVDDDGKPLRVYHGTTHDIEEFTKERANVENDLGAGYYFSSDTDDASENYAGEGPDLKNRLEQLAERIQSESDDEVDFAAAMELAREQLSGGAPNVIPVYLKIENPVVIDGEDSTLFDLDTPYDEETEEFGEPTGKMVEFFDHLREAASDFHDADAESAIAQLMEDYGGDVGGVRANTLIRKLRSELSGATDDDGQSVSTEIIRRAFEAMGFDGIIDHSVERFNMKGVEDETIHYIVFKPTQIKSAVGNTTFDPKNPKITKEFNPNQPRDERGRWTDQGGGADFVEYGPLDKKIIDYKPDRTLSDKEQVTRIDKYLDNARFVAYSKAPFFDELNAAIGVDPAKVKDIGDYITARDAFFRGIEKSRIEIDKMVVTQTVVNKDRIKWFMADANTGQRRKPIQVVRYKGETWIINGHHRVVASAKLGKARVNARVWKPGKIKKADRPLVQPLASFRAAGDAMIRMISSLNTSRVASFGFTGEATARGFTTYSISEQLDVRICPVCEEMHGKTFAVADARTALDDILNTAPEGLAEVQPWPGQDADSLAELRGLSAEEIVSRNWHIPPYHPNCRGILVMAQQEPRLPETEWQSMLPIPADDYVATLASFREYGLGVSVEELGFWNTLVAVEVGAVLAGFLGKPAATILNEVAVAGTTNAARAGIMDFGVAADGDVEMRLQALGVFGAEAPVGSELAFNADKARAIIRAVTMSEADARAGVMGTMLESWAATWTRLGIEDVQLLATGPLSSVQWATYGFLPDRAEWDRLRARLAPKTSDPEITALLDSQDPRTLWVLAGTGTGYALLATETWAASLNLLDPDVQNRLRVMVTKAYDPDQPRDDHGRWVLGVGQTATVKARDLVVSDKGFSNALQDVHRGRGSRTAGPVEVWKLPDGRLLLVDGYHRFAEAIKAGRSSVDVKVVGEGYTDYHATPGKDDLFDAGDWLDDEVQKYDPDQPRHPAGSPDGGQWVGETSTEVGITGMAGGGKDITLDEARKLVEEAAGFPVDVEFAAENDEHIEVGGTKYEVAARAFPGVRIAGTLNHPEGEEILPKIVFYPTYYKDRTRYAFANDGLMHHEVQHLKNAIVQRGLEAERPALIQRLDEFMRADGTVREGKWKEFSAAFPISAAVGRYLTSDSFRTQNDWKIRGKLEKEDGVTQYSKSYWVQAFTKGGNGSYWSAVDETLAEISALTARYGKKSSILNNMVKPSWRAFHNAMERAVVLSRKRLA